MATYEGYCRPLKQKVQFIVESVNSLDTTRGIKWSIKGKYDGHKISTFTNKAQAELLLNQLNDGAEDLEVFGAEIAVQEAESIGFLPLSDNVDDYSTHLCKHCGDGIYYHLQGGDIGNQPARMSWCGNNQEGPESCDAESHEPYEGEADGINATYKTSIIEEPNLVFFERAVNGGNETNGGVVNIEDATGKMYDDWDRIYLSDDGQYVGYSPETTAPKTLSAKHYRKDGSLDMRYKICREMASEQKAAENKCCNSCPNISNQPIVVNCDECDGDICADCEGETICSICMQNVCHSCSGSPHKQCAKWANGDDNRNEQEIQAGLLGRAESFDAETYNKVYRAEPNAIIFEENIPAEVWNTMGPDAQGHYLSTRDETVLIAPCCGVTKAELRLDEDANADCNSCCYSGDDFHPRWWANRPKPQVRIGKDSEDLPVNLTYGNTATVPVDIYYKFMFELPSTVTATVTDDGFSMILGFHNQDAALIDALIEGYSPYQDAGNPSDTLYAENTLSFVPSDIPSNHNFEAESQKLKSHYSNVLNYSDAELDALGAEYMDAERGCYPCPNCGIDMFVAKHRYGDSGIGTHCSCSSCGSNYNTKILGAEEMFYYHGTDMTNLASILKEGIRPTADTDSRWGEDIMDISPYPYYYAEIDDILPSVFVADSVEEALWWADESGIEEIGVLKISSQVENLENFHGDGNGYKTSETIPKEYIVEVIGKTFAAEEFNVEFEDWGKQEMKTHGKNISFKEWINEESDKHGDVPLTDWAEHEEESHDERYGAEEKTIAQEYSDVISDLSDLEKVVKKTVAPKRKPTKYIREAKGSIIDSWRQVKKDGFSKELYQPIEKGAETFAATTGTRMYCHICNKNRTWMKGFMYNDPKKPFYVCNTCDFAYDPKHPRQEEIKNWRTTLGYEAEKGELKKDSCCCGATKKNPCECMYEGVMNCSATSPMCPCYKAINKGVTDKYWGDIAKAPPWDTGFWAEEESFEADATSCFECGRFGYDDEMMRIDYGYLCARCSNPDVDFSKIMSAEDSKKINKKFIGLLGIGALGAYFAPKEIKKLFDNMKKS